MGAFGDDARRAASRGNWLTLGNGDSAEVRLLAIGKPYDKEWADGSQSKAIKLDLHVFVHTKLGQQPERVDSERVADPQCAWISDLIDLSDKLDVAEGDGAIFSHKIKLHRIDRPGKGGFRYGWIDVTDLGRVDTEGPRASPSAPPAPHRTTNAAGAPGPAPVAPPRTAGASTAINVSAIETAGDLQTLKAALQSAWAPAKAAGQTAAVQAAYRARKAAILRAWIEQAPAKSDLDLVWSDFVVPETRDDAAMAAELWPTYTIRAGAFATADDIPF